jgi:hypothetical protein
MYSSMHSLTSALDGGEWSASRPGRFTTREIAPGTHWIGIWVGPRAVLDTVVKRKIPSPRRESNPFHQTVQPIVNHYTDWEIINCKVALMLMHHKIKVYIRRGDRTVNIHVLVTRWKLNCRLLSHTHYLECWVVSEQVWKDWYREKSYLCLESNPCHPTLN